MMKKIILILFPLIALGAIFYYMSIKNRSITEIENVNKVPLEFEDNKVQCPQCNMFLVGKRFTAQVITSDNKTHFFDDPGCMILWLEKKHIDPKSVTTWIYTLDTKKWIDAKKAYYSISDPTPMRYGFGAYEHNKKGFIDFDEMRLRMLRGENMTNPKIRKKILAQQKGE